MKTSIYRNLKSLVLILALTLSASTPANDIVDYEVFEESEKVVISKGGCQLQTITGLLTGLTLTMASVTGTCAAGTAITVVGEVFCLAPGAVTLLGLAASGISAGFAYLTCKSIDSTIDMNDLNSGQKKAVEKVKNGWNSKFTAEQTLELVREIGKCNDFQYKDFRKEKFEACDKEMKSRKPGNLCNGTGLPQHLRRRTAGANPGKVDVLAEMINVLDRCISAKHDLASCFDGMDDGHKENVEHLQDLRGKCDNLYRKYLKR